MRLVSPPFVNHEGKPIFSCDIHPDGLRFATGGQGPSSGRIAIWSLRPVLDPAVESDEYVPKSLCVLDNHANCVNSVRWSNSGKNLASGGDDKLIMIWIRVSEPRVNSMGTPITNDVWRLIHTLTAHESVVLDLAWGPNDTRLASCSVDNSVIVWNMDGKPAMLTKLLGHTGMVKGVVWDPVGEYLASQSDDKTLRIWRTRDWKQQTCISEPFKDCSDVTHVLRLDWSPDGLYVVSAHASNSGGPTAQIVDRANDAEKKCWGATLDFVGHRKAVTCVKFNKNLLTKPPHETKFCLAATGSRDCSIVIWSTQQRRPIVAMKNCFARAVVDLSWGLEGKVLMACSWDGTVMFIYFKTDELGRVVAPEEKLAALEKLYGKRVVHGKVEPIVEFPELIDMPQEEEEEETKKEEKVEEPVVVVEKETPVPVEETPPRPVVVVKQIETKLPDGKRRITPIVLPPSTPNSPCVFSSKDAQTKIVVEQVIEKEVKRDEPKIALKRALEEVDKTVNAETSAPSKRKKSSLVSNEISAAVVTSSAQRPIFDPRPAGLQLRALAMSGAVNLSIIDSSDIIVVESIKDPAICKIRRESRNPVTILWENVLAHPVVAAKSNKLLSVFLCSDRSINILDSNSGAPLRLPVLLPGPAACIDLTRTNMLCIVTTCGYVLVYDLIKKKQVMRDSTLKSELLANHNAFSLCRLRENGLPLVIFNNGRSFAYSADMGWELLTDVKTSLWQLGGRRELFYGADMPFKGLVREVKASTVGPPTFRSNSVQSATSARCCTSLLYHQLHAADQLGSQAEFKAALLALIKELAQMDAVPQIRELLNHQATPRGLLSDCLSVIKGFLSCQRLYSEMTMSGINAEDVSLGPPTME